MAGTLGLFRTLDLRISPALDDQLADGVQFDVHGNLTGRAPGLHEVVFPAPAGTPKSTIRLIQGDRSDPTASRQNALVDRRDRKEILGQWGVREPTPKEQESARRLARDLDGSPLAGRPLPRRTRLRPPAENYVASLGGPLPYMQRRARIEEETRAHERRLHAAWHGLAEQCGGDRERFARRWRDRAHRWVFDDVNELIDQHNRWFPAESRLPMDPRTGEFVLVHGERYDLARLDAGWILARFPAELSRVAA